MKPADAPADASADAELGTLPQSRNLLRPTGTAIRYEWQNPCGCVYVGLVKMAWKRLF